MKKLLMSPPETKTNTHQSRDNKPITYEPIALEDMDYVQSSQIFVDSNIAKLKTIMKPYDVMPHLTRWVDGLYSVEQYLRMRFDQELQKFAAGNTQFWVQARLEQEIVGWACFSRSATNTTEATLNWVVVKPNYQAQGIGEYLIHCLEHLNIMPELTQLNLMAGPDAIRNISSRFCRRVGITNIESKQDNSYITTPVSLQRSEVELESALSYFKQKAQEANQTIHRLKHEYSLKQSTREQLQKEFRNSAIAGALLINPALIFFIYLYETHTPYQVESNTRVISLFASCIMLGLGIALADNSLQTQDGLRNMKQEFEDKLQQVTDVYNYHASRINAIEQILTPGTAALKLYDTEPDASEHQFMSRLNNILRMGMFHTPTHENRTDEESQLQLN